MKFENRIVINAPASAVWNVFTDETVLSKWLSGYKSSGVISGQPLEVGSKHEMVFEENGKEMKFIETVTQVEINSAYGFSLSHEKMCSKNLTKLSEVDGKTTLIQYVDVEAKSFFYKMMMPLIKSSICKKSAKDLQRLKELVESN